MADKRPLFVGAGRIKEIPASDTIADNIVGLADTTVGAYPYYRAPISTFYYDNNPHAGVGTLAGAANRFDLAPYFSPISMPINQIGCVVSTAVAASTFKVQIYSMNAAGWPDALLFESAALSGATAAYAFSAITFTFAARTGYWLGVRHSSTCTLRTNAAGSSYNLGAGTTGAQTGGLQMLRRTLAFATAAPNPFAFTTADLVGGVTPPNLRWRAV